MANTSSLSIVIPVFNEKDSIPILLDEIHLAVKGKIDYKIICIDDGSSDGTFEYLRDRSRGDNKLRLIQFQRNYGKSAALAEGFKHIHSEYVITLDSDLQDDPREILDLLAKLEEGFDLVSGWKKERNSKFRYR